MTRIGVTGINLNVETYGSGEPLVLLMGLGAYSRKWEQHRKVYEQKFQCICIDNRGAGLSDAPKSEVYTTGMMALDTIQVLEAMGIQKAHFHGISMGGAIAQEIAIRWPKRVKSLTLTSTFSQVDAHFGRALEILRDSVGKMDGKVFAKLLQYMIYSPKYHAEHMEEMRRAEEEDERDSIQMAAYAYRAQCNACLTHDTTERLGEIKAPTLIAAGEKDLFVSQNLTRELHQGIAGSQLYLCKDGGHVHHWEKLETFNHVTMSFLEKHAD